MLLGNPECKIKGKLGLIFKKEPRKIHIKELTVKEIDLPDVSFRVHCSKGTYIRQLAIDIGKALGSGAHISSLRRIKSGAFKIEESIKFEDLSNATKESVHENLLQH